MKIHYFTAAGDTWAIWDCPFDGQNFYFLARGDASCMSDAEIDIPDPNSFISNDKYDVYEYFNTEYGVYDTVHYNIYGSSIISRPCLHVSNHLEATAYSVIRDTGGNVLHSPDINTITGTKDYMFFVPGYSWAKDDISIRSKRKMAKYTCNLLVQALTEDLGSFIADFMDAMTGNQSCCVIPLISGLRVLKLVKKLKLE